ncbi:MAG: SDR family NAD(P)-dependent oxidoreductase [Deltaproteobacteria bacterium]|nr:SDR family NAD(P)-dependent oxidoreductase [Deltaproteobacteria bacterium]
MGKAPVVIITGASRGIGGWVARCLGKVGASVTILARSKEDLSAVARDVEAKGGRALTVVGDIRYPEIHEVAVEKTVSDFGQINAIVNNAGIAGPLAPVSAVDPEQWMSNIQTNLLGPFYMARSAIPELRKTEGRIVNVGSGASTLPIPSASAYCASKAALNHFTAVLAQEEPTLTVVAVRPGMVDTGMQALLRNAGPGGMPPEQAAFYRSMKNEGKLEPPLVPARSIAWLSLHAPRQWSGDFLDYDNPQIALPALELLGESA